MSNYFVRNLETQKIELYFDKQAYTNLDQVTKSEIKSCCLFSNYKKAWISRSKIGNTWRIEALAKKLQLEDRGTEGEALSFADQIQREQDKAAARQETSEERAARAAAESTAACNRAVDMLKVIPMGQPILVGHHSERGHRSLLQKSDNAMRKSVELDDKAAYYENKAANAEYTASGTKFKNMRYLVNRIKECEAGIRTYQRFMEGKGSAVGHGQPTEQQKAGWQLKIDGQNERLSFFREKLGELLAEKPTYNKETLKELKATHVMYRGRWYPLKSFNQKTVTFLNWIRIADASWQMPYELITEIKTVEDNFEVLDGDGNVAPWTVKH